MSAPALPTVGGQRRLMVVSADMGGGHEATADALEQAAARLWPQLESCRVDTLDLMGPGVGRLFRRIYVGNVEHTPWLYEFFYASLWRHRWFARASKQLTGGWAGRRLHRAIDRFDPDLVVSTYPLGSAGLAWLRRRRGLGVPATAYVSDVAPHPFWVHRDLDATFVVGEASRSLGWAADPGATVEVAGPVAREAFTPARRSDARAALGLEPDALVVLVSCGTYAFGDVVATVRTLLDASPTVQVVAACGRNEQTRRRLDGLGMPGSRLRALGWTPDVAGLVQAADLVLSNAGGAIALEAMACRRALLMYRPIAAHGEANADIMVVSGLADLCTTPEQLTAYIRGAVEDRAPLRDLEARSALLADPGAARRVLQRTAALGGAASAAARGWPMRASDAFFAHVEDPLVRQEIGAVLELGEVSPGRRADLEEVRAQVQRGIPGLPALRRELVAGRRPAWRLLGSVEARDHVDEVSAGQVGPELDRFWSESLPATGPPWQMRLVHGPDRSVLAVKMHHCLGDGVSALALLDRLLDTAPDDPLVERRSRTRTLRRVPRRAVARGTVRAVARGVTGLASLAGRGFAPQHPLGAVAGGPRRVLVTGSVQAEDLRALAAPARAHTHEVALALGSQVLVGVLGRAGLLEPSRPLRVMVPTAIRAPRLDRVFGNWTGTVALDLDGEPLRFAERLSRVRGGIRRCSARGEPEAAHAVMRVLGALPAPAHAALARAVYGRRFFGSILSYMPAARRSRWMAGAPVRAVCPVVPLAPGVPVTAGVVLSDGVAGFGFLLDARLGIGREDVGAALDAAIRDALAESA